MRGKTLLFVCIITFLITILSPVVLASENNTPETAIELVSGQQVSTGITYNGDVHWFKINVEQTSSIISEITNNSGYAYYELYDSSINRLQRQYISPSGMYGYKVSPGTYYIKLCENYGINYLTSNITLKVTLKEEDPWENNDTSANAYEIFSGQELQGIAIEACNDSDWYKINVEQTSSIVSEITNNSGYAYYELYDSSINSKVVPIVNRKF